MEMTIDEAFYCLSNDKYACSKCRHLYSKHNCRKEAVNVVIDAKRKYQKIQEIVTNTDYIDEDVIKYKKICEVVEDDMLKAVNGAPTVEAIPKADYENRLKADLVAMLTEIKKEIEENLEDDYSELDEIQGALRAGRLIENVGCAKIIQQKINTLKGE